jgi:hypothetical protein
MRLLRLAAFMFSAALLVLGILPRAQAGEWNEKTVVTFTGPVEIPGFNGPQVLRAGTYVFKLLNSRSDRNIVQIFNKNESHLYATILAVPDYRLKPTGHTVIKFQERAEGSPQAIKAWFYPGDLYGQRFVYPRSRAIELAKANHEPVLSMPDQTASDIDKPIKTGKEPAAVALEKTTVKAEEPNGQEVASSQVVQSKKSANGG